MITWNGLLQLGVTALITMLFSVLGFLALLPTKIGERLIAHHFDAKLADIRHEQGKEMGRLQSELDHLKDRGIRSNEREYQAITGVWEATVDAYFATRRCIAQLVEHPDFQQLSDEEVRDLLSAENIIGRSADAIVASSDRNAAYSFNRRAHAIYLAGTSIIEALTLLDKQSVFVPNALAALFEAMLDTLNEARAEQNMNLRSRTTGERIRPEKSMVVLGSKGRQDFEELRDAVRARLLRTLQLD